MSNFLHQIAQPCAANVELQLADLTVLNCQKVVRVVPNKRVVCQALWQSKPVYAKLFFGTNAAKYAARDAKGSKQLAAANIDTPALLAQTETLDKTAQVLIFEAIEPANSAEETWPTLTSLQRGDLLKKLAIEVGKHHNAGLIQTDMYFKNFLVAHNCIYTLDGDGIRQLSGLFKSRNAQQNLATLFSKMDVLDNDWIYDGYSAYCQQRNLKNTPLDAAIIWLQTQKIRRQKASHYADKKVFRQCSDVNRMHFKNLIMASANTVNQSDLPQSLKQLNAYFMPENLLKDGNTCTVALVDINGLKVVIKRYNIKNVWHGFTRAFRQTRAAASWANAHRLKLLGIDTAQPIALIEQRPVGWLAGGLRGRAYFLAEYIDAPDVADYFAKTQNKTARAQAVKNIVSLFYKLHLLQISHGDMKANNIKMQGAQPVLIDLDSMRQHSYGYFAQKAHMRDLKRFMQNWHNQPALYNAFVKTFKVMYDNTGVLQKAGIDQNKEISHKEISE